MSLLDAHPTPKPGAYWPDGFRENAQAIADKVAAERHRLARVRLTGARPMVPSRMTEDDKEPS